MQLKLLHKNAKLGGSAIIVLAFSNKISSSPYYHDLFALAYEILLSVVHKHHILFLHGVRAQQALARRLGSVFLFANISDCRDGSSYKTTHPTFQRK